VRKINRSSCAPLLAVGAGIMDIDCCLNSQVVSSESVTRTSFRENREVEIGGNIVISETCLK
jgi:hypothetical protein